MKKNAPTFTSQDNERVNLKITYYGSFNSADYSHERYGSLYEKRYCTEIVHWMFMHLTIKESKTKQRFVDYPQICYLCAII